jgi:hypothetical protein
MEMKFFTSLMYPTRKLEFIPSGIIEGGHDYRSNPSGIKEGGQDYNDTWRNEHKFHKDN